MKTFVTNEVLTAGDLNVFAVNTLFARKTAIESVASTTVLQNDDHLVVAVAANSTYELSGMLHYDGAAAGDLKLNWTGPTGATLAATYQRLAGTAAAITDDVIAAGDIATDVQVGCTGGGTNALLIHGLVRVGSTAGNFRLTWAQWTADATATRLLVDSFICLRRVD